MSEATSGNLNDPVYVAARANAFKFARTGIDAAVAKDNLDAIVAPHLTNTSAAAVCWLSQHRPSGRDNACRKTGRHFDV